MRAGALTERCGFEFKDTVGTPSGGKKSVWVKPFTLAGRIDRDKASGDTLESGESMSEQNATLTVRDTPNSRMIRHTWRVSISDRMGYAVRYGVASDPRPSTPGFLSMRIQEGGEE